VPDDDVFEWMIYALLAVAVITPIRQLLLNQETEIVYGRHDTDETGPRIDTRLAWLVMEAPASLVFAYYYLTGPNAAYPAPVVLFFMWQLHYVHRAFIYPWTLRVREGSSSSILLPLGGGVFCAVNGYLNGIYISTYGTHLTTEAWLVDPCFLGGCALFVIGYAINKRSDQILRNLRAPGETGYKIPRGALYELVSCPNYFGELLQWTGFAIAGWSIGGAAFAAVTAGNLIPRAVENHRWYHDKFEDYPSRRRAVIPFLL